MEPSRRERLRGLGIMQMNTALAVVAFVSGIANVMSFGVIDPLSKVLPGWLAGVAGWLFLFAGLWILVGLYRRSFRIEALGLVFLGASLIVREVVYVYYLGLHADALTSSTYYAAFLWGCWARFRMLLRGEVLVVATAEAAP